MVGKSLFLDLVMTIFEEGCVCDGGDVENNCITLLCNDGFWSLPFRCAGFDV